MPKRTDIKKIAIIGAGPILIGQACEFDYSGTQACKSLREEGYEIVLINSNPATIMTDPGTAERTYIEPLTIEYLSEILRKERPDAILPTLGGQTALNLAFQLADTGIFEELGIEMIGADREVIHRAEDREAFRSIMQEIGIGLPKSMIVRTESEAAAALDFISVPCVVRPSFTLGGTGGGIAYNKDEYRTLVEGALAVSMVKEVLIEESLAGWKEFEMEMMRDRNDNVVVVCSIENMDPMGIHTGDSITVAPVQTMTDREYQLMRDASLRIIRAVGAETGGCNIQFAQHPKTGRLVVIEMNPRVSRSSALASKATGFPIAKIAAKLAVGMTLDELRNDITQKTAACFEPTIDYCVAKIPRFAFEKFPDADEKLSIQMKSVGEVMAMGRTFKEAIHKAIRSTETGRFGFFRDEKKEMRLSKEELELRISMPIQDRLYRIAEALRIDIPLDTIYDLTGIDKWFLYQIEELLLEEDALKGKTLETIDPEIMMHLKRCGFGDRRLAELFGCSENEIRTWRLENGIIAVRKMVDTCGAEFEAKTPYYYLTYGEEDESADEAASAVENSNKNSEKAAKKGSVLIIGGGPNRIGQGIEFDYCCCHAAAAVREAGLLAIMMNCNPETVSTDYETSDALYFEPLTLENVLDVIRIEKPLGVVLQFGGQTPLNLSEALSREGVPILGTSVDSIVLAEDRKQFGDMLRELDIKQPPGETVTNIDDALEIADRIGYPVLMRPSFVLGGAKMEKVFDRADLIAYWDTLSEYSRKAELTIDEERPILIDAFLEDALEIDVDAICDGETVVLAGLMEHIEEAGVHSGDSACSLPPQSLTPKVIRQFEDATLKIALRMQVKGLLNIQFALRNNTIYVLEVNPRASRTVPFVGKVLGCSLPVIATKIMLGEKLDPKIIPGWENLDYVAVKEAVFPWTRFPGVDTRLSPEMKSTGEVMGIAKEFPEAFAKAQLGAGTPIPVSGNVFLSVKDTDKPYIGEIAKRLQNLGFSLLSTRGTAAVLESMGISVQTLGKIVERVRPNIIDLMIDKRVQWIINTPSGKHPHRDEVTMRTTGLKYGIPLTTTLRGAKAMIEAIESRRTQKPHENVAAIQDYIGARGEG